jgi:hypothetical protein
VRSIGRLLALVAALAAVLSTAPARADDPPGEFHATGTETVNYKVSPLRGPIGTVLHLVGSCHYGGNPADGVSFRLINRATDRAAEAFDTPRPDGSFDTTVTVDDTFQPGPKEVAASCSETDF